MDQVIIRDVEKKDFPAIKAIISETWDIGTEDEKTQGAILGLYLNQVLYWSSFGKAAVLGGKVVGVIFGFLDEDTPKYRMLQEDGMEHVIKLLDASENDRKDAHEYLSKTLGAYDELVADIIDLYDGSLDFFVVSEEARGLGVGKRLWGEIAAYFKENGAGSIYVYTDTLCNFGFYDHNGFQKKREYTLTYNFSDGQEQENILLYDYKFR